jgi:Rieske Fe-S protein
MRSRLEGLRSGRCYDVTVLAAPSTRRRLPRRTVLRLAGLAALVPLAAAAVSMMRRLDAGKQPSRVRVGPAFPDQLTLAGEVIVSRGPDGGLSVFSSRCPHLGCRIDRVEHDLIACPCHGSRFRPDGSVVSGPARRPLTPLAFTRDPATGVLVVDVP